MILHNGRIHTLESSQTYPTAVAVRGETVLAVGSDAEVLNLARPGEERIDLAGRTVIPGLVDAHIHLYWLAQTRLWVDLQGVTALEAVLERVAARAAVTPAGEWIQGRGWNQNLWPTRAFPTAADLDHVAPGHPVYLIAQSGHGGWCNSLALKLAEITPQRPDPPGGQFQRDAAGQLTGIVLEEAMKIVRRTIGEPPIPEAAEAIEAVFPDLWAAGITGVHCMDSHEWTSVHALEYLHAAGRLGLRVLKYLPKDRFDEVLERGYYSGQGDDWLRVGGVKLFADGALGVRTGAMLEPYEGEPDNCGMYTLEPEELADLGRRASAAELSLAVHAIGDRTNRMALDQLAQLPRPAAVPHRIEHVQIIHPDDLGRLAAHGITASMQPIHAPSDMEMAERHWGERTRHAYAFCSVLEAGTRMAFGSDAPVESFAPLLGMHAAVTRRRVDGAPGPDGWHPEQRLTLSQALRGFTLGAAEAAGTAHKLGTLRAGKLADLVVLDRDLFAIDPQEIPAVQVLGTMIGGRWVRPLELD